MIDAAIKANDSRPSRCGVAARRHRWLSRSQMPSDRGEMASRMVVSRSPLRADQVDLVAQPIGELRHRPLGVVAGSIEPPVNGRLHSTPKRLEEREGDERRRRDGDGLALDEVGEDGLQGDDALPRSRRRAGR